MTKSETISNLKAYLDGDTAIGNIIPLRSVLEAAVEHLESSIPFTLNEAISNATKDKESATRFLKSAGIMDANGELAEMYRSDEIETSYLSMEVTDDTEWADVDSFIHKNVDGGSIIQIRKK